MRGKISMNENHTLHAQTIITWNTSNFIIFWSHIQKSWHQNTHINNSCCIRFSLKIHQTTNFCPLYMVKPVQGHEADHSAMQFSLFRHNTIHMQPIVFLFAQLWCTEALLRCDSRSAKIKETYPQETHLSYHRRHAHHHHHQFYDDWTKSKPFCL